MYQKQDLREGKCIPPILPLLFMFVFSIALGGEATHINLPLLQEKPVIVFTNSMGQEVEQFTESDSVYGTFTNLIPKTEYTIQVLRTDGKVITQSIHSSGDFGIIHDVKLWENVDVSADELTGRRADAYHCLIKRGESIIEIVPIKFISPDEVEPVNNTQDEQEINRTLCSGYSGSHIEAKIACQAPPQDLSGMVIGAPIPTYKDVFSANEQVWAAVSPYIGGRNYVDKEARLYVVYHKQKSHWLDGTSLSDVSGGYEAVTIKAGGARFNYTRIWNSPSISEKGYDVVVDFAPFGIYDRGQDIVDRLNKKGFHVPELWVCLESVSFNHDPDSTTSDALNIRMNYTEDVHVPEWKKAQKSYPAAYIKKSKITVKAIFSAAPGVTSARIKAVTRRGWLKNILPETVLFNNGTSCPVYFEVASYTPTRIKSFIQEWRWYCYDINGSWFSKIHLGNSENKIFVVLEQPQAPWTTTGQTEPWVDALEISCWWAWGTKTPEDAAAKITRQLYKNIGGLYDNEWGMPYYPYSYDFSQFALTDFLENIPNVGLVNCYDMGKSLVTISNALGCGLSYRYCYPFGHLNCIYGIGRSWTNNPFHANTDPLYHFVPDPVVPGDWSWNDGRSFFVNHAFGSIGENIFDATLTVDTDEDPDDGPIYKTTWMINVPWEIYKDNVVDDYPIFDWGNTGYPEIMSFDIY
jgi:hypothetical protein